MPDTEILATLVRDVADKVDRNRIEINSRLDSIVSNFVLRSEFAMNNEHLRATLALMVPRTEIEAHWIETARHIEAIDEKISTVGKMPAWAVAVAIGLVLNVTAAIITHFVH